MTTHPLHSRNVPRAATAVVLVAMLTCVAPAGFAESLPLCLHADAQPGYKVYLDGLFGEAMHSETVPAMSAEVEAFSRQLARDIENLKLCANAQSGICPSQAKVLGCENRKPEDEGNFPPVDLHVLDVSNVVLESWMKMTNDVDDDEQPIHVMTFSYLLVPASVGADSLFPPRTTQILAFERTVPVGAKRAAIRDSLNQSVELKALTYVCSGIKRMRALQYDDAYTHLQEAHSTILAARPGPRREKLRPVDQLVLRLARETWKRARADTVNPSHVSALGPGDLDSAWEPMP